MQTYVILRRSGWRSPEELQEAAARSIRVADEQMPDDVRWLGSYVLEEGGGSLGTVCVYQATGPGRSTGTPARRTWLSTRSSASSTRWSSAPTPSRPRTEGGAS